MSASPPPTHRMSLDARQRRVLGVLIEKAKTTPGSYPMTVNAIVTACNQKNNRDPLTAYDEIDVENTLGDLAKIGLVAEVDWMGRVSKFKHLAYELLGVSKAELAVLAELLLRGAQPLGDLRARAARMEPIADLAELKPIVDGLIARDMMIALTPPGRGQVVSHHFYRNDELTAVRASHSGREHLASERVDPHHPPAAPREPAGAAVVGNAEASRGPDWAGELEALRAEVARLGERVRQLEARVATDGS